MISSSSKTEQDKKAKIIKDEDELIDKHDKNCYKHLKI